MRLIQYAVRSYIKPRPEQYLVQFAPTEVVTRIQDGGPEIGQVATRHAAVKPWRHVAWRGVQPSSCFAFALDAPRPSCRVAAAKLPARNATSHPGTRIGAGAPTSWQNAGIQSRAGAGSSSTMLYAPSPRSSAATAAPAASSTWTNEKTPLPLPTIGSIRRRAWRAKSPLRSKYVPRP